MKVSIRNCWHFTLTAYVLGCPSIVFSEVHGALTATSNYVWRGYSKSHDNFSGQANLDYQSPAGGYAGTWVSIVDFGDQGFNDRAQFEIIPYLGWNFGLSDDWRLDLQWSRYFYDGKVFGEFSDYNEFYGLLHYSDLFTGRVSFSEDYYHRGHTALDFELSGRYPVTDWLQFSSGFGYSLTKKAIEVDYLYWNAGLSLFYEMIVVDLRYLDATETAKITDQKIVDVQQENYPETLKASFVFSISIGF